MHCHKAVSVYISSKHVLSFGFAEHYMLDFLKKISMKQFHYLGINGLYLARYTTILYQVTNSCIPLSIAKVYIHNSSGQHELINCFRLLQRREDTLKITLFLIIYCSIYM